MNTRDSEGAGPWVREEPGLAGDPDRLGESLRHRAEQEAGAGPVAEAEPLSLDEARALLHELRVHQIELEMQNEELRRTQDELEASRQRYFHLYDQAPVGYLTVSEAGIILEANLTVAALLGTTRGPLRQRPLHRSVLLEDRDIYYLCTRKLFATGAPQACELRMVREDDSDLWARMDLALAEEGSRQGRVFRVTVIDVTGRHAMEERLHQAEKLQAIGLLAGGVAHDLNNRLTGVLGYADLLCQRLEDETLHRYALNIRGAARCSADLIGKLLAFARKGKYQDVAVNMHRAIAEVSELILHGTDGHIDILQHLEATSSTVQGDPSQLLSAVLNLGLNARDAMPEGGALTFSTRDVTIAEQPEGEDGLPVGPCLEIRVTDTGTGMEAETQKHLFEPFFTTKELGQGTGLGLASVYGTVRSHHGVIRVQSQPRLGTTFTILLPLARSPDDAGVGEVPAPGATTVGASIMVVDDESSVREVLGDMLRGRGYRVVTCADGEQAVIQYGEAWQGVDLVILDISMPGMGGLEAFRAMRAVNPKVRALLASGHSLAGKAQAILDEGVLGFLQKPFSQADLVARVEEALRGRAPKPYPGV